MKPHRLAASVAAATAIVALGGAGVAHAETPTATATPTRITSAEQLQAGLQQAIGIEQAQAAPLGTGPAGKAID